MNTDPAREAPRLALAVRALVRGSRGSFDGSALDISRTGVRMRVLRSEVDLGEDADIAEAAARIQTRIGSRFAVDLAGLGRGTRLRKRVQLVRLALSGARGESLDLGCAFDEALAAEEARALGLRLPATPGDASQPVRTRAGWSDMPRPPLDPRLAEEKVDQLFAVPSVEKPPACHAVPRRPLRAVLRPAAAAGVAPLVARLESFTECMVVVCIAGRDVAAFVPEPENIASIASAAAAGYGAWPRLELLAGTRRLWHGAARIHDIGVRDGPERDVRLSLVLNRRLPPADRDRLRAA